MVDITDYSPFQEVALNHLQRQYGYTNISDLCLKKAAVWDKFFGNITQVFNDEILNFNTCTSEALDNYWGKIYRITRNFESEDGGVITLTDDEFREVIKIRAFGCRWDGSVSQMNEFLKDLFGKRGVSYMKDPQDMTFEIFTFNFELTENEVWLFSTQDILPRPAGVGVRVEVLDTENTLGFYGSDFQPFGQGVFWNGSIT